MDNDDTAAADLVVARAAPAPGERHIGNVLFSLAYSSGVASGLTMAFLVTSHWVAAAIAGGTAVVQGYRYDRAWATFSTKVEKVAAAYRTMAAAARHYRGRQQP